MHWNTSSELSVPGCESPFDQIDDFTSKATFASLMLAVAAFLAHAYWHISTISRLHLTILLISATVSATGVLVSVKYYRSGKTAF
ncbi:hypothetical protein CLV40_102389 [Actinokineospora auranticolor]|uniref:Uncharacterized protein n=1 Tax=Actinokineospora auranticolor TaxID=155976 RepID=A0A2S6GZ16_9PSEU|nr:hypothetical protein CLV40_102389 [Actinokineospora auranticolor]